MRDVLHVVQQVVVLKKNANSHAHWIYPATLLVNYTEILTSTNKLTIQEIVFPNGTYFGMDGPKNSCLRMPFGDINKYLSDIRNRRKIKKRISYQPDFFTHFNAPFLPFIGYNSIKKRPTVRNQATWWEWVGGILKKNRPRHFKLQRNVNTIVQLEAIRSWNTSSFK